MCRHANCEESVQKKEAAEEGGGGGAHRFSKLFVFTLLCCKSLAVSEGAGNPVAGAGGISLALLMASPSEESPAVESRPDSSSSSFKSEPLSEESCLAKACLVTSAADMPTKQTHDFDAD